MKFILLELVQQSMEMALSTCTNWAFISARALSASFRKTHRIVFLDGILIPENPRLTRRINAGSWNCRNDQLHHTIASNSNSCSSSSVAIDFLVKLWISLVPSIVRWWTAFLLCALICFVKLAVLRLFKYHGWAYFIVQPSSLHKTTGILYSLSTASWKGPMCHFSAFQTQWPSLLCAIIRLNFKKEIPSWLFRWLQLYTSHYLSKRDNDSHLSVSVVVFLAFLFLFMPSCPWVPY